MNYISGERFTAQIQDAAASLIAFREILRS